MGEIDAWGQRRITTRERAGSGNGLRPHALIPPLAGRDAWFSFQRTDTDRRSRRTLRARFSKSLHPRQLEGAGNAGCALHPRSRVQWQEKCAHEHTGQRRASDIPCAMALRLIARSPLVIGFLATIVPEKLASRELDASTEASGPRVFVVRVSTPRQRRLCVHRNPPLVRDDGQRPSSRDGMAINMPPLFLL